MTEWIRKLVVLKQMIIFQTIPDKGGKEVKKNKTRVIVSRFFLYVTVIILISHQGCIFTSSILFTSELSQFFL